MVMESTVKRTSSDSVWPLVCSDGRTYAQRKYDEENDTLVLRDSDRIMPRVERAPRIYPEKVQGFCDIRARLERD